MKLIPIVITALLSVGLIVSSCGSSDEKKETSEVSTDKVSEEPKVQVEVHGAEVKPGDVTLTNPLNAEWVTTGKATYDLKCQSCHNLTEERKVGPGWKNVTQRRQPHWILNMVTNVEMMLEKDPEAQKLLEQCLVRMPNQNLTVEEARKVLEFMRSNDGVK